MLSSDLARTEARGDRAESFADLALSHIDLLFNVALRLTRNRADAEDLVQDTFVKAFRSADRFEWGTSMRAWLLTILKHTFLNEQRRVARNPVRTDGDIVEQSQGVMDPAGDPERHAMAIDAVERVRAGLGALPRSFRETVWLRDVLDLSYQEIAELLGVPAGTVMSRLSRGRRMLHDHLTRELGVGPAVTGSRRLPSLVPLG